MNLTEHRKYALVVLGLFFIWGGVSFYWYACSIKNLCNAAPQAALGKPQGGLGTGGRIVLQTPKAEPCKGLVFNYIIPGAQNDTASVKALEYFLYTIEGEDTEMDGIYGQADILAVKRFQQKYRSTILAPYGLTRPTGAVREATLYVINTLYCSSVMKQ